MLWNIVSKHYLVPQKADEWAEFFKFQQKESNSCCTEEESGSFNITDKNYNAKKRSKLEATYFPALNYHH